MSDDAVRAALKATLRELARWLGQAEIDREQAAPQGQWGARRAAAISRDIARAEDVMGRAYDALKG